MIYLTKKRSSTFIFDGIFFWYWLKHGYMLCNLMSSVMWFCFNTEKFISYNIYYNSLNDIFWHFLHLYLNQIILFSVSVKDIETISLNVYLKSTLHWISFLKNNTVLDYEVIYCLLKFLRCEKFRKLIQYNDSVFF